MSPDLGRLDRRLPRDSIGGADRRSDLDGGRRLADFTVDRSVLKLVALALVVGALSAGVALALLALIGFFTHLAYYGDLGWRLEPPSLITEKVVRRGFHVMREYAVDPLEAMFVREVMQPAKSGASSGGVLAYSDEVLRVVAGRMAAYELDELTVVDRETGIVAGTVTVFDLLAARRRQWHAERSRERPLQLPPLRLTASRR